MVCNCGSAMSMSAQTGGVTWWRCVQCGQFQSTGPGSPPRRKPARAAVASPQPMPMQEASAPAPAVVPAAIEAVAEPDGCAVCSSPDVTYALSTDVTGTLIRVGFCSIECLAQKLGLTRAGAHATSEQGPHRMTGT
jgi:hypothetical protein